MKGRTVGRTDERTDEQEMYVEGGSGCRQSAIYFLCCGTMDLALIGPLTAMILIGYNQCRDAAV